MCVYWFCHFKTSRCHWNAKMPISPCCFGGFALGMAGMSTRCKTLSAEMTSTCIFLQVLWNFTCLPPGKLTYVDPENEQFVVETSLPTPLWQGRSVNLLEATVSCVTDERCHISNCMDLLTWSCQIWKPLGWCLDRWQKVTAFLEEICFIYIYSNMHWWHCLVDAETWHDFDFDFC